MFKEMTDAELLDFCENNFCEYEVCQALKCEDNCKDEDCPLNQLFERFKKNAVIVPDTNVGCKSEWISVDERLPEEDTRVLVYLNIQKTDANIYTFFDTDRILNGKWVRWNKYISHWMPLPEVPKMKGGAE